MLGIRRQSPLTSHYVTEAGPSPPALWLFIRKVKGLSHLLRNYYVHLQRARDPTNLATTYPTT